MTRAIRALLSDAIDYAGLFPPASLGMDAAVEAYDRHRWGGDGWMLGRFIVPSARWAEFEQAAGARPGRWRVSVLGEPVASPWVEAVESPAGVPLPGLDVYREVALEADLAGLVTRAKVRTGGVTAGAFPPSAAVAGFLRRAREAGVAFKATAGLHHPLRGDYRLTYEPGSACGRMHGFINLLVASVLTGTGADEAAILEETDPRAFLFGEDGLEWRGHGAAVEEIERARRERCVSFGSCSFDEPAAGLRELGWL